MFCLSRHLPRLLSSLRPRTRTLTTLSARRPLLSLTPTTQPKISSHPALQGTQVRTAKRNTFRPSHFVRKRRHGFLARKRSRTGRAILTRRRLKGRTTLSH
ncbi:MAG: hypothetical protein M1829_006435 [Trizodia sp. TS-e1964]|nr:MAG: hypothetical protein M1829_006435 [Trizodia sp. TS-e1964]